MRGEIEYLRRYVADQNQYLEVKYRDGRKENEPGCVHACFCNSISHATKNRAKNVYEVQEWVLLCFD